MDDYDVDVTYTTGPVDTMTSYLQPSSREIYETIDPSDRRRLEAWLAEMRLGKEYYRPTPEILADSKLLYTFPWERGSESASSLPAREDCCWKYCNDSKPVTVPFTQLRDSILTGYQGEKDVTCIRHTRTFQIVNANERLMKALCDRSTRHWDPEFDGEPHENRYPINQDVLIEIVERRITNTETMEDEFYLLPLAIQGELVLMEEYNAPRIAYIEQARKEKNEKKYEESKKQNSKHQSRSLFEMALFWGLIFGAMAIFGSKLTFLTIILLFIGLIVTPMLTGLVLDTKQFFLNSITFVMWYGIIYLTIKAITGIFT